MVKLLKTTIVLGLTLLYLTFSFESKAQALIFGIVEDLNSGQGIPNHTVNIVSHYDSINQSGMSYYKNIQTNTLGFFIDTVSVPTQDIDFIVSTADCNQVIHTDTFNPLTNSGIINFSICSNLPNCFSNFYTYEDTSDYKRIHFINNSSGISSLTYFWTFGDGGTSSAKNPIHYYLNDGVYNVCLTVSQGNCTHSSCNTLTVSSTAVCNASFTTISYGLDVSFTGNSGSSRLSHFLWDFGDGNTTNGQKVQHKYSQAGDYIVTLNTLSIHPQTLDTCLSSYIDTITVKKLKYGSVYGQVFADTNTIDEGTAFLFKYDIFDSVFYLSDTSDIFKIDTLNISYYRFEDLLYGDYIVKIMLDSNSALYSDFAPSYSGNTFMWNKANVINVDTVTQNVPINLIKKTNSFGLAQISGYVLEGNSKAPGDPVGGVLIYLVDNSGKIHDYQFSRISDGYYLFDNIAYNNYKIYADIINRIIIPPKVTVNQATPIINNLNIYLGSDSVTNINDEFDDFKLKIFPNPVDDILNFSIESFHGSQSLSFEIYNTLGQQFYNKKIDIFDGINKGSINLSEFKSDIYILRIIGEFGLISQFKIVKL